MHLLFTLLLQTTLGDDQTKLIGNQNGSGGKRRAYASIPAQPDQEGAGRRETRQWRKRWVNPEEEREMGTFQGWAIQSARTPRSLSPAVTSVSPTRKPHLSNQLKMGAKSPDQQLISSSRSISPSVATHLLAGPQLPRVCGEGWTEWMWRLCDPKPPILSTSLQHAGPAGCTSPSHLPVLCQHLPWAPCGSGLAILPQPLCPCLPWTHHPSAGSTAQHCLTGWGPCESPG